MWRGLSAAAARPTVRSPLPLLTFCDSARKNKRFWASPEVLKIPSSHSCERAREVANFLLHSSSRGGKRLSAKRSSSYDLQSSGKLYYVDDRFKHYGRSCEFVQEIMHHRTYHPGEYLHIGYIMVRVLPLT